MSCTGNCLICGQCNRFPILEHFDEPVVSAPREGFGLAVDLGSTTVVMTLLDLTSGRVVTRHSFLNPQRAFGADIMSRVEAARCGKAEEMRLAITGELARGLQTLLAARSSSQIIDAVIAGNTVMTCLLLGYDCSGLAEAPFTPPPLTDETVEFERVFGVEGCPVRIVPWFSAFVGGDAAAGLFFILSQKQKPQDAGKYSTERFLLLDLGTNSEMVFYDGGIVNATAAAAGSAFVTGGASASAMLKILAVLVRQGRVTSSGQVVAMSPLSRDEIRSLQTAKSAVRAGLALLCEEREPDTVYLAGGIGQAVSTEDAMDVGMLPAAWSSKTIAAGNTSLGGCCALMLEPDGMKTLRSLAPRVINLAEHPRFSGLFTEFTALQKA